MGIRAKFHSLALVLFKLLPNCWYRASLWPFHAYLGQAPLGYLDRDMTSVSIELFQWYFKHPQATKAVGDTVREIAAD